MSDDKLIYNFSDSYCCISIFNDGDFEDMKTISIKSILGSQCTMLLPKEECEKIAKALLEDNNKKE